GPLQREDPRADGADRAAEDARRLHPHDQPSLHRHPACLRPHRRCPPGTDRGRARPPCPTPGANHGRHACPHDRRHAGRHGVSLPAVSTLARRLRGGHDTSLGLLAMLILLGVILSMVSPYFLTTTNLLNIGRGIAIVGIVAVGETIVIVAGGFDLSVGSTMAAAGMTAGWL